MTPAEKDRHMTPAEKDRHALAAQLKAHIADLESAREPAHAAGGVPDADEVRYPLGAPSLDFDTAIKALAQVMALGR